MTGVQTCALPISPDFAAILDFKQEEGRPQIIEILKANGINFGEGSSAGLTSSGMLMVTNTPSELDKIEQLVSAVTGKSDWTKRQSSAPAAPAKPDER